jgi:pimeloyl-ACP methyl ester carboxylesterase
MRLSSGLLAYAGAHLVKIGLEAARRSLEVRVASHRDRLGRKTPYLELGAPKLGTLVYLHGFSDRSDTFLATARHLRDRYRVVIPAMPGFGEGWIDPSERHTFEAYAGWLGELVAAVAEGPVHLVGHSMGGGVAATIAVERPELLASLALVDAAGVRVEGVPSVYDEIEVGKNLFEVRDRATYRHFQSRVFEKVQRFPLPVEEHLYREMVQKADWHVRLMDDLSQSESMADAAPGVSLDRIRVPTMILWGDRDSLFPLSLAEHAARLIPDARMHVFRGIGHCPHLECPRDLAAALDGFLRPLARGRA